MKKFYIFSVIFSLLAAVTHAQDINDLPLFDIAQLSYKGGFRIDSGEHGVSNINYSQGPIAYNHENNSIFIVGHTHEQAIAEFAIPEIINSDALSELAMVETPMQVFSQVLDRTPDGNPQGINRIGGMYYVNQGGQGRLIVNGYEYYDAPADNTLTTFVINDPNALETSSMNGYLSFNGGAGHTSGWISPIPEALQVSLGGSHITGQSSGIPIISRLSVGPSAFAFDMEDALNASNNIPTTTLLDFSLDNPLNGDLFNDSGENNIWTHLSNASYGFIVPGTRTYLTIGYSGGHISGVCYKCAQDDGDVCGGYCTPIIADNYQFYWLWDLNDLLAVKEGSMLSHDVRPYDYGAFNTPFQVGGPKRINGGSFDPNTGDLYLSIARGDTEQGTYSRPPVVVVYNVNSGVLANNDATDDQFIKMYPNPTTNTLFIKGLTFEADIRINDLSGRLVTIVNTLDESAEISMSGLARGLYAVSITNKATNVVYVRKIVKQ